MGSSISGGHGAQKAFDMAGSNMRVVSVLGDSTFFHSGLNSLINVAYNKSRTVNIILDNRITAMTGHQDNPCTGRRADGAAATAIDIEAVVRAIGIRHIRVIDPNDLTAVKDALNWGLSLDEPSVIITRWPCVLKKLSDLDHAEFPNVFTRKSRCRSNALCGLRALYAVRLPSPYHEPHGEKGENRRTMCRLWGLQPAVSQTCDFVGGRLIWKERRVFYW